MSRRSASAFIAFLGLAVAMACGGSSDPLTSPGPPPTVTPTDACGAIGGTRLGATAIVNGADCSLGNSAVVLINLRNRQGDALGACSGTVIAPRAVLTGAHCLDEDVAIARIWLGTGPEIVAESFTYYPGYGPGSALPDVGILRMGEDLRPSPVPLLTSRDARVGETAVIAGWGRDQSSVPATLRAGTAVISSVGPQLLETAFTSNASSICSGDSGGPILLSEGGTWSIAGIISATSTAGCTTGTAFYVNLRHPNAQSFILTHAPEAARR